MNNRLPEVTVVTPCYNHAKFLPEAIESVLDQTFKDFEYFLVDDGSTDNSFDVMTDYAKKDSRISVFRQENKGVAESLNRCIKIMNGKYFVWVPADDAINSDLLKRKLIFNSKILPENRGVIYSSFMRIDSDGNYIDTEKMKIVIPSEFFKESYRQCFIGFTGIFIPRIAFDVAGLFSNKLSNGYHIYSEDYYWMLKAAKLGVKFHGLDDVLFAKRIHQNRTTAREYDRIIEDIKKIKEDIDAI